MNWKIEPPMLTVLGTGAFYQVLAWPRSAASVNRGDTYAIF